MDKHVLQMLLEHTGGSAMITPKPIDHPFDPNPELTGWKVDLEVDGHTVAGYAWTDRIHLFSSFRDGQDALFADLVTTPARVELDLRQLSPVMTIQGLRALGYVVERKYDPAERYAGSTLTEEGKRCSCCGRDWSDPEAWASLHYVGDTFDGEETIEMRNCTCEAWGGHPTLTIALRRS